MAILSFIVSVLLNLLIALILIYFVGGMVCMFIEQYNIMRANKYSRKTLILMLEEAKRVASEYEKQEKDNKNKNKCKNKTKETK